MNSTVYLETSIIGYLASRPSRDLITAANQQLTRDWWDEQRAQFAHNSTSTCRKPRPDATGRLVRQWRVAPTPQGRSHGPTIFPWHPAILLWYNDAMTRAYDEIVEFIAAGTTPDSVARFEPSQQTRDYVADLIHKEKTVGLTPDESSELDHFLKIEHLMRLAKARARTLCSQ